MKETKKDHKDNTGIIIAAIVASLLIVGLIAYYAMNGNKGDNAIDDETNTIENTMDNNQKTAADVDGSYQASINNDNGEDVAEDTESFIELVLNEDGTAKLYISDISDKTISGTFTINDNSISVITTNTTENTKADKVDETQTTDETNDSVNDTTTDNSENMSYSFTINADDTITYNAENDSIVLAKVDNDSLRYIK